MVQLALAYAVLLLIVLAILWTPARPSVAIALYIGMYGTEQILASSFPVIASASSFFNYMIGCICAIAIVIAVLRNGFPRPPIELLLSFSLLFGLVCLSLLWTTGPELGAEWVAHFAAEMPLAIILPIATLRSYDDFKPLMMALVPLSICVALGVIDSPIISSYSGRTYLTEGGTVLSPAEFMGIAMIFVSVLDKKFLGALSGIRMPIMFVLTLGTLLSGARGQFLLSVGLVALIFLVRRYSSRFAGLVATIFMLTLVVPVALVVIVSDHTLPSFRASDRFTEDSLRSGFEIRFELIERSLTLENPILGHGIGAWSQVFNHVDSTPGKIEGMTLHPHNSIIQAYFEIGIIGMLIFLWISSIGPRLAMSLYAYHAKDPALRTVTSAMGAYFIYSFMLSMKQSTFLAAAGIYLSVSMLTALRTITGSRIVASDPTPHLRDISSGTGE